MSFLPTLSFATATSGSRALCSISVLRAAPLTVAAVPVAGAYTLFERVNVFSFMKFLVAEGNNPNQAHFWSTFGMGILSGLDELAFVVVYLLSVELVVRAAWRASHWQWWRVPVNVWAQVTGSNKRQTSAGAASATAVLPATDAEVAPDGGPLEFDEGSLAAALLKPAYLLGWTMLALWGVDAAYLACVTAGLASGAGDVPRALSYVAYTYVAGAALVAWKNRLIEKLLEQRSSQAALEVNAPVDPLESPAAAAKRLALGVWRKRTTSREQVTAANKFLLTRGSSILLWVALGLVCLDAVSLNVGVALGSALSFAGVGGLAVGLATKDLASNLVGGCLVFVTQPFVEGDTIAFEKLPPSKVAHIGWYQTTVVGDDEQVMSIPNAKFVSNTISNYSRRSHLALRDTIYLNYDAVPKLEAIVDGIREALGELPGVDRSSRSFLVYAKAFGEFGVEIEVNVHFKGSNGLGFRKRRQAALVAIAKVAEANGASFAIREKSMAL